MPGDPARPGEPSARAPVHQDDQADTRALQRGPYARAPFALLGHSLGAIVAYELARCFTADGDAPARLFVSGRRPPGEPAAHPPVHWLSDADFLAAIGTLGGTPDDVIASRDLIRLFLPALRADFELNETYSPLAGVALACPISALVGEADPEVSPQAMSRWRAKTSGPCSLRVFPGGHFYLKDSPHAVLDALADDLRVPAGSRLVSRDAQF